MDEQYLRNQIAYLNQLLSEKNSKEGRSNRRTLACQMILDEYYLNKTQLGYTPYDVLKKALSRIYVKMMLDYCYLGDNPEIDTILDQVELIEDYLEIHLPYLYQD